MNATNATAATVQRLLKTMTRDRAIKYAAAHAKAANESAFGFWWKVYDALKMMK